MKLTKKELKYLVESFLFEDEESEKDETKEPTFSEKLEKEMEASKTPVEAYNKYRDMSKDNPDEEVDFPEKVKEYLKGTLGYEGAEDIKKTSLSKFEKDHGENLRVVTNAAIIKNNSKKA